MLRKGRYLARMANTATDVAAAQRLRHRSFFAASGAAPREDARDADPFDDLCSHVLVEDTRTGAPVCCFRLLPLRDGARIGQSYSAQYYGLSALEGYRGRMVEMGRFCIDPSHARDPDILRVAWGSKTRYVDDQGIEMLFGCSSFRGTEAAVYQEVFALLHERHLAPGRWLPKVKAPDVFRFASNPRRRPDERQALRSMPPLLRTYLMMGGWVSDHAVVDHDLNTLHVFTGLEIATVPASRKRALRMVAA